MRACAYVLGANVVLDVARETIGALVLRPYRAAHWPAPYTGAARVAFHLEQAAFIAWPAIVCALAWSSLSRSRAWPVLASWSAAAAALVLLYPEVRGEPLGRVYRALTVLAVLGGAAALLRVTRAPGRAGIVSLALLAGVAAELAGPYLARPFEWWPAQLTYAIVFTGLSLTFGVWHARDNR